MSDSTQGEFQGTNRFSILRRLGAGAFGAVYQAYDRERDRIVALKVLRQKDPSALYYFKKEFRTLSGVIHPNLVTLYNLMSDGEDWFFTMELVEGVDFLTYVRGRGRQQQPSTDYANLSTVPLYEDGETKDQDQATTLRQEQLDSFRSGGLHSLLAISMDNLDRLRASLAQLGRGICAIHSAGKLHRDLKPSNVLVTQSGRVVILDFGLITDLRPNLYESTLLAGTPNYMSPEQAAGLAVAEASDLYAVGVILYEALTGDLPFHGHSRDILRAKQRQEPRAPHDLISSIPEDLSSLCSDLLRLDPTKRPSGREFIHRLKLDEPDTITNVAVTPSIERVPFVGRERQLSELNDALRSTKNRQPVIALVHGISGIGKSTLVRHFLESLEKGDPEIVVLDGRCYEQESVPYKAFDSLVDALSRYLSRLPILEAESVIPRDVKALARLFPVLLQVEAVVRARWRTLEGIDLQELRRRGFSALRELLSRLSDRRQLVLFIDDLQWGDTDSAALLSEICRPPDAPALLLIGAYRTDAVETSSMLKAFLPSVRATGAYDIRELQIEELDDSESFNLALSLLNTQMTLTSGHALTIARESGGSPLFINELSHYLTVASVATSNNVETTGSIVLKNREVTLEEVINARYRQLPESARRLLEIVAVAGKPVERSVASRAARLDQEEEESLIMLRSNYLVRTRELQDRQEIETYHDRIRETVNAHLSPGMLKDHHHRLALALEMSKQSDSETLAVHHQGAGDYERAADYAVEAAEQASSAFAFDRAARLYQLALELQPQSKGRPLRIRLAEALANAGRGAEAANVYLAALDGAKAAEVTELRRRAAEQLLRSGHIDQGLAVLRTVLSSMGLKLSETPWRALISFLRQRALARLRGLSFLERDESQISPQQIARIDTCWSVAVGLSMVDVIRGAEFQARHLLFALRAGEPSRVVRALTTEAAYTSVGGSHTRLRTQQLLKKSEALAKQLDQPDAYGRVLLASGISAYLNGEWKKAVDSCEDAERILREQCKGVTWERHTACHFSLMSLLNLGEWDQVWRRLPNLLEEAKQRGDLLAETNLSIRMSYILLLAADELDKAHVELREGMKHWSQKGFHTQHYYDLIRRTEIALYSRSGFDAWNFITRSWSDLRRSLILRIQTFRIELQFLVARSALAAAVQSETALPQGPGQKDLLRAAAAQSRKLQREGTSYAKALCLLSRACLASIGRKETDVLVALLSQAEVEFVANDMALHAAATRWRRGEIIGGDEGRSLITRADEWMRGQKIKNPLRIVEMLSPGLSR